MIQYNYCRGPFEGVLEYHQEIVVVLGADEIRIIFLKAFKELL
jgi:hypothetical protein